MTVWRFVASATNSLYSTAIPVTWGRKVQPAVADISTASAIWRQTGMSDPLAMMTLWLVRNRHNFSETLPRLKGTPFFGPLGAHATSRESRACA